MGELGVQRAKPFGPRRGEPPAGHSHFSPVFAIKTPPVGRLASVSLQSIRTPVQDDDVLGPGRGVSMASSVAHQLEESRRDLKDAEQARGFARKRFEDAELKVQHAQAEVEYWKGVQAKIGDDLVLAGPQD